MSEQPTDPTQRLRQIDADCDQIWLLAIRMIRLRERWPVDRPVPGWHGLLSMVIEEQMARDLAAPAPCSSPLASAPTPA